MLSFSSPLDPASPFKEWLSVVSVTGAAASAENASQPLRVATTDMGIYRATYDATSYRFSCFSLSVFYLSLSVWICLYVCVCACLCACVCMYPCPLNLDPYSPPPSLSPASVIFEFSQGLEAGRAYRVVVNHELVRGARGETLAPLAQVSLLSSFPLPFPSLQPSLPPPHPSLPPLSSLFPPPSHALGHTFH